MTQTNKPAAMPVLNLFPGEIIFSEGDLSNPVMYVIKTGQVEISIEREAKKIVLSTLGKGQLFGEMALISSEPRSATARALTACEFHVIEAPALDKLIDKAPPVVRFMLRSLIAMIKRKDEIVARHANTQSLIVACAQLLEVMAKPEVGQRQSYQPRRHGETEVALELSDVTEKCMRILRQSRHEALAMLRQMFKLNLIVIETGHPDKSGRDCPMVRFSHADIVERAQQLPETADLALSGFVKSELELIELADLEAQVGIGRELLLKIILEKGSADELLVFRKSHVLACLGKEGLVQDVYDGRFI